MNSPHKLDPSRLQIIKGLKDAALSIGNKISDDMRELCQRRSAIDGSIRTIEGEAQQNRLQRHDAHTKIVALQAEREKVVAAIAALAGANEDASEKRRAIGQLYVSCAEYLGVNPHA